VVRVDADLFSAKVERILTMLHRLELMMVAEVRISPESAVDHMWQTLFCPNLKPAIKGSRDGDTLRILVLVGDDLLQLLKSIALSQLFHQ